MAEITITRMVRDPATNPQPHAADVQESEIASYRSGNFVLVSEANFDVKDLQIELTLDTQQPPPSEPLDTQQPPPQTGTWGAPPNSGA